MLQVTEGGFPETVVPESTTVQVETKRTYPETQAVETVELVQAEAPD